MNKQEVKKRKLNDGDYLFFCAVGMYLSSLLMGLSINDFTFAKEVITPIMILAISGVGYSEIINFNGGKHK